MRKVKVRLEFELVLDVDGNLVFDTLDFIEAGCAATIPRVQYISPGARTSLRYARSGEIARRAKKRAS